VSFFSGWGEKEREEYVWTLQTPFHARCRNVGGDWSVQVKHVPSAFQPYNICILVTRLVYDDGNTRYPLLAFAATISGLDFVHVTTFIAALTCNFLLCSHFSMLVFCY